LVQGDDNQERELQGAGSSQEAGGASFSGWTAFSIGLFLFSSLVGFAFYISNLAPPALPDFGKAATLLPTPRPVEPFELTDHRDERFDRDRLLGTWSLFFFGYTYCPDICPTTLQALKTVNAHWETASALAASAAEEAPAPPQVVFVSVDPDRDSPARIGEYIAHFDDSFVGATGTVEQLETFTRSVGVFYSKVEPAEGIEALETEGSAPGYLVAHSSKLYLVDPQGRLRAVLDDPHDPAEFADMVTEIQQFEHRS
jgi:protein SCO1/2